MCQLTLIHSEPTLVRLLSGLLLLENSVKNPDGWGFYTKKTGIVKSEKQALYDTELQNKIEGITDNIFLGHVRLSSYYYKQNVNLKCNPKDSHPFEQDNLILAHNGSLHRKFPAQANEGVIDSEDFAIELNKEYELVKDMKTAITNTYGKYDGTFAFLILNKKENKYYIVRGKKKLLHYAELVYNYSNKDHKLNVVNTDRFTLELILNNIEKILSLIYGKVTVIKRSVELIPENSIHTYDPESRLLVRVGDVVETEYVEPKKEVINPIDQKALPVVKDIKGVEPKNLFDLGYFLGLDGLDLDEIRFLFKELINIHVFDLDVENDIQQFTTVMKYFDTKKKGIWIAIKSLYVKRYPGKFSLDVYTHYELEFPYFLNSLKRLKKVQRLLQHG